MRRRPSRSSGADKMTEYGKGEKALVATGSDEEMEYVGTMKRGYENKAHLGVECCTQECFVSEFVYGVVWSCMELYEIPVPKRRQKGAE